MVDEGGGRDVGGERGYECCHTTGTRQTGGVQMIGQVRG